MSCIYTAAVVCCCCSRRCPHNEVPGSRYYRHDDIYTSTYKRSMFCHTCFASNNTWSAGSAVGLRIECTYLHNKREGCTYCLHSTVSVSSLVLCGVRHEDGQGSIPPTAVSSSYSRRVETRAYLISSQNVIYLRWFVGFFSVSSAVSDCCLRAVSFGMRFDELSLDINTINK